MFRYFTEAEELSTRLMHTIIDIRNDENGRVVLEEAKRDRITNPFDLQCIYFEELLSKYWTALDRISIFEYVRGNISRNKILKQKVEWVTKISSYFNCTKLLSKLIFWYLVIEIEANDSFFTAVSVLRLKLFCLDC